MIDINLRSLYYILIKSDSEFCSVVEINIKKMNRNISSRIISSIKDYIDKKKVLENDLLQNQIKMRNQSRFIYREEIINKFSKGIKTNNDHDREVRMFSEFRESLSKKIKKDPPLKNVTLMVSNFKNIKKSKPVTKKIKNSESIKRFKQTDTNLPRPLSANFFLKFDRENNSTILKSSIFQTQLEGSHFNDNTDNDKTNLRSALCSAVSTNIGTERFVRTGVRHKSSVISNDVSSVLKRKMASLIRFKSINPKIAEENPDYFDRHMINPLISYSINHFRKAKSGSTIKYTSGTISVPLYTQLNNL